MFSKDKLLFYAIENLKKKTFHVYRKKIAEKSLSFMLFPGEKPPEFYTKLCVANEVSCLINI